MRNDHPGAAFAVAPMMDWTDRHCRYFMRILAPHAGLYTEMVTAMALKHGDSERLLRFDPSEHPLALQLGGSDPALMAEAARMGEAAGYDEININVGCPSDRVRDGQFGACLMARPEVIAECVAAMKAAVSVPVTVKTRIGIDDQDNYAFLKEFVTAVADGGCDAFVVHARKAILTGLSPKENRSIPPLDYERVYRLKQDFLELTVVLNGGITSTAQASVHLKSVDGVMIGRQAYHDPWVLTEFEREFAGEGGMAPPTRQQAVERMLPYIEAELAAGTRLQQIARHLLGLFAGQPGARAWRRHLSEHAHRADAGTKVLYDALSKLPQAA